MTVGTFDGCTGAHAVLQRSCGGRAAGRASVLVTFEPHPLDVVNPAAAPPRLTTADERLEVLSTGDLERMVVLRFDGRWRRWGRRVRDDVLIGRAACGNS